MTEEETEDQQLAEYDWLRWCDGPERFVYPIEIPAWYEAPRITSRYPFMYGWEPSFQ